MVTAAIRINGDLGSKDHLPLGVSVTLESAENDGVTSWGWKLISVPTRESAQSHAEIDDPTASTCHFTPDVIGSYLIQLTVNGRIKTRAIVAAEGSGDAQSVVFVVCQKPF